MEKLTKIIEGIKPKWLIKAAWLVALVATAGSLYFSEVWGLNPCKLCWFQRIFMYPLGLILAVGWYRKERRIDEYVLPMSLIGTAIALYHNIIYYLSNYSYGVSETVLFACSGGIACTDVQVEWFGFITIPLMSLTAFLLIDGLMWTLRAKVKGKAK